MVSFSFCVGLLSQGKYNVKQCCFMCVSSLEIRNCLAVLKEQGPGEQHLFAPIVCIKAYMSSFLSFCLRDVNTS